ncbi:hypothetical protein CWE13_10660 [Aliidiomarina shirensis]|uniref:Cellulose biosynthesis protein BcsE n=1 Tax=Aliidiomarina shirensis TaxID=1048642 RepID=A0A432WQE6_9GAMM|nr:BcsE family c-di-GMP-binding protein [Aliidiomarina shirensis]RUO35995.1 hypothetical protein CWE13_10660 [Aliidiomarina shirensis]
MISLQGMFAGIEQPLPQLHPGETHTFVHENRVWSDYLLAMIAQQSSVVYFTRADDLQRIFRNTPDIRLNQNLVLAEWKAARSVQTNRMLNAIMNTCGKQKTIILALNFISPELLERNFFKNDFFSKLQSWCKKENKLLLLFCLGSPDQSALTSFLDTAARKFSSLHIINQGQPDWSWDVQYWFNGYTVSRWQWDVHEETSATGVVQFSIATHGENEPQAMLTGEKAPRYFCANALEDGEYLPQEWQRFSVDVDVRDMLAPGNDAVVILGLANRNMLVDVARTILQIRQYSGRYVRILVRERDESLRLQDERFLINAGATLVLPHELSTRSFISLAETTIGFRFTQRIPESFEELRTNHLVEDSRGYFPPQEFLQKVVQLESKAEKQGLDTLFLQGSVATGLTPLTVVRRFGSRRQGDMITVIDNEVCLFFYGCRETDLNNVLFTNFGIPANSLFKRETRVSNHSQILEVCEHLLQKERSYPSDDLSMHIYARQASDSGDLATNKASKHDAQQVRKANFL